MTSVPGDIDDLKTLQREVEELRKSRTQASLDEEKESGRQVKPEDLRTPEQAAADEIERAQTDSGFHDLAEHLEMYAGEIEEAAKERPMLALLAAFSVGIIVGKLFSRR